MKKINVILYFVALRLIIIALGLKVEVDVAKLGVGTMGEGTWVVKVVFGIRAPFAFDVATIG